MDRASLSQRVWALAVLVPIACIWGWFVSSTPIFRWNNQKSHDDHRVVFGDYLFDFSTQTATRFFVDETTSLILPSTGRSYRIRPRNSRDSRQSIGDSSELILRVTGYDHLESRIVHDFDVSVGTKAWPYFANRWFVLIQNTESLLWLDWTQGTEDWKTLSNPGPTKPWVWPHPTQPVFRRSWTDPARPTQATTELFRLGEDGQLRLLSSWTHLASATPTYYDTKFSQDRIYSVDITGALLESRSILDGSILDSFAFEVPVKSFSFSLTEDFLIETAAQPKYYSMTGKRIGNPFAETNSNRSYLMLSSDARVGLWSDFNRAIVTDPESGRIVCEIQEPGRQYVFLDAKTLISWGNGWGLTLRQHDLQTGETLVRWRPFWWVWPCLAVLSIATLVWVVIWIRIPTPNAAWGWFDFYFLMSLCMILLVARVLLVGESTDLSRLSFVYAQAVCSSGILIAWYMLFFSSQRWIVRLMHLLSTYLIVLFALVVVLHENPLEACQGLILVSVPTLVALPFFVVTAVFSWRFNRASITQSFRKPSAAPTRSHVIQIRDLFGLMAIVAIVLVTIQPLLPGMGAWLQVPRTLIVLSWVTLCAWFGVVAALARNKQWMRVGTILVATAFFLLALNIVMICMAGEHWQTSYGIWLARNFHLLHSCLSALVVSFFLARCLKLTDGITIVDPLSVDPLRKRC